MSFIDSPPLRRLSASAGSRQSQEELINAYEAEEERIVNVLSRKLEQLREDKIELENVLEAESELAVNRLSRELGALRMQNGSSSSPADPHAEVLLDAMRRENEELRRRLVDTERDYIRISRLNEIYREELIEHRNRLGLPVDNLVGMSRMSRYSTSNLSSPSTSVVASPRTAPVHHSNAVPIPRPASQIHRPLDSSSSSESPFPISMSSQAVSYNTTLTSPPSSSSFLLQNPGPISPRGLTYPSVPPPSLSSSFGSHREPSLSPNEPLSRRNSNVGVNVRPVRGRVAETGSLASRRTGSVGVSRSRAGSTSTNLPATEENELELEPERDD